MLAALSLWWAGLWNVEAFVKASPRMAYVEPFERTVTCGACLDSLRSWRTYADWTIHCVNCGDQRNGSR